MTAPRTGALLIAVSRVLGNFGVYDHLFVADARRAVEGFLDKFDYRKLANVDLTVNRRPGSALANHYASCEPRQIGDRSAQQGFP